MNSIEGFTYQVDWTPALLQRALRFAPGRGAAPLKLTMPAWFTVLLLTAILAPLSFLGLGIVGLQHLFAYLVGFVAGGAVVGSCLLVLQRQLVAGTNQSQPLQMQVRIAPSGVFLATLHFRNEYTWQAIDRVVDSREGLLIWMGSLLIAIVPDDALPGHADRASLKRQIDYWRRSTGEL